VVASARTQPSATPGAGQDHAVDRDKPAYRAFPAAKTAITPLIAVFGHPAGRARPSMRGVRGGTSKPTRVAYGTSLRAEPHAATECDRSTQTVILTQPRCATPVTCEDLKLAALHHGRVIGSSTAWSSKSRASGGTPCYSWPSTAMVGARAAGRSARRMASSASAADRRCSARMFGAARCCREPVPRVPRAGQASSPPECAVGSPCCDRYSPKTGAGLLRRDVTMYW
jgi:hypothetical protein